MASIDSGMEMGNECNDGQLDVKDDTQVEQMPKIHCPSVYPMLTEGPSSMCNPSSCIFGSLGPHFKLPHASLPLRFEEGYTIQPGTKLVGEFRRMIMFKARTAKLKKQNFSRTIGYRTDEIRERKLRVAVSTNNIEMVHNYLFTGVNPNCVDSIGRSPLHLASCNGYSDIVRLLLENGANPNQRDRLGNTPLHLAACTNNIVVVTLLLKAGTDVCSSDLHGRSPLQLAQSKLRLLQRHMDGDRAIKYNQTVEPNPSVSVNQYLDAIHEIRVYDNGFVTNQALQIVEMMRLFLHKRGQDAEAELLSAFSTRLTLSETKEQVKTEVRDLLNSLSSLSLDSTSENQNNGISSSNIATSSDCSIRLFSNALPAPSTSSPSSSFVPASKASDPSGEVSSLDPNKPLE